MNRPTFQETVGILVKAYMNDTLQHEDCYMCAVGNIVANSLGIKIVDGCFGKQWEDNECPEWDCVFCTSRDVQDVFPEEYHGEAKKQIDATGYTWQELAKVEYAFETAPIGKSSDERMFNGLMAVVDVLAEIHQVDLSTREDAKAMFVKP